MRINNIIRRSFNFPLDIETVTYAITYKCNSQCMMCNIWKNGTQRKSELSIKEVNKLFRSELLNHLKGIQITGGGAFHKKRLTGSNKRNRT